MESISILHLLNYATLGIIPNLLLFLVIYFILNYLKKYFFLRISNRKIFLFLSSLFLFILFHLLTYAPGKLIFEKTCKETGDNFILEKTIVNSVYIPGSLREIHNIATPEILIFDEKIKNFLFDQIEFLKEQDFDNGNNTPIPHVISRTIDGRYSAAKTIQAIPPKFYGVPSAKYTVELFKVSRPLGIKGNITKIYDTKTKKTIAQASVISFEGGILSWLFRPSFIEHQCAAKNVRSSYSFYDSLPFIVLRGYPEKN